MSRRPSTLWLILGVGIGDPVQWDFGFFGEETDAKARAAQLDDGVTWWIEEISPWRSGWSWEDQWSAEASELMRQRVRQGSPRGPK